MLLAMLFLGIMAMEAKNEKQPTYLYGFATSFNDSTVYFAEIQLLDDAWVDSLNSCMVVILIRTSYVTI